MLSAFFVIKMPQNEILGAFYYPLENVFIFVNIWGVSFHKHHEIDGHIRHLAFLRYTRDR